MKRNYYLLILCLILDSCHKRTSTNSYAFLQGNYVGNIYHWHRDYDSNHNVIETFDTIFNVTSTLEIDEATNIIKFDGVIYQNHKELKLTTSDDTISALKDFSVRPENQFRLIKSIKNVTIVNSVYSQGGDPYADQEIKDYFKN